MPTIQITGTANIEDTSLIGNSTINKDNNWGGSIQLFCSNGDQYRDLVRLDASQIPAGVITGFRLRVVAGALPAEMTIAAYRVVDANDWVEGDGQGTVVAGAATWNQCKHGVQSWASGYGTGCGASGTDYDADASPPTAVFDGVSEFKTFELPPQWAVDWRDAIRVSNGVLLRWHAGYTATLAMASTENVGSPPYWEVDYTAGPPTSPHYFRQLERVRR